MTRHSEMTLLLLEDNLVYPEVFKTRLTRGRQNRMSRYPVENSYAPIMNSGHEDDKRVEDCLLHGAQNYLLKSNLNPSDLIRSIQFSSHRKKTASNAAFIRLDGAGI